MTTQDMKTRLNHALATLGVRSAGRHDDHVRWSATDLATDLASLLSEPDEQGNVMARMLDRYVTLQQEIFAYFGYEEDWRCIPLDDHSGAFWMLEQREDGHGFVAWSDVPFTEEGIREGDALYSASIYTQRFLPQWVYPGAEYTMVCTDTHTDQNKFLMIFTNSKRCEDATFLAHYKRCWGEK